MDWILDGMLALAIGFGAVAALILGVMTSRLMRVELRAQALTVVPRDEVPAANRAMLETARPFLETLGFAYRYTMALPSSAVAEGDAPVHFDVYEHADGRTHAAVYLAVPPDARRPCNISYSTLLTNGRMVVTTNGAKHLSLFIHPRLDHEDGYFPSLRAAWELHERRIAGRDADIVRDGVAFFRATREGVEDLLPAARRLGVVARRGKGWYLTLRGALVYAVRWQVGQYRAARMLAAANAGADLAPVAAPAPTTASASAETSEAPSELQADVEAFQKHLALQRGMKLTTSGKWKLFVLSALAFLAVGSLFISWTFLPILLAVIALHEAGHFLAMKLSGYGNLSVFFVPGLGGLAAGEKPDAGPWEKLFVYLAGPLPGIALAVAGIVGMLTGTFQPPPWFIEFLWACLIINYLNLLPITPLDGGRIVETFLFARFPTARFGFAFLGFAALLAGGAWTGDKVMLVIAVLVGFSLPHQWRVARVDRAVERGTGEALDERSAVERIFAVFQQPKFQRWSFLDRAATATTLLPELQGRRAGALEAVGGLTIYAVCLVAPIALAAAAYLPQLGGSFGFGGVELAPDDIDPEPPVPRPPARNWFAEAERHEALPEPQRLQVLLNAIEQPAAADHDGKRAQFLKAAADLAEQRPPRDAQRVRTLMLLAEHEQNAVESQQLLQRVVSEVEGSTDGEALLLLAQAKTNLSYAKDLPGEQRVALRRDVVAHLEQAGKPASDLSRARMLLAHALAKEGLVAEAEAQLRRRAQDVPVAAPGDRSRTALRHRTERVSAQVQLAWFLVAQRRPREAASLLEGAAAAIPDPLTTSWEHPNRQLKEAAVWAHIDLADNVALRAAWERYEDARRTVPLGGRPSLQHEVDRFVVAQALRDATLEARARKGIDRALAGPQSKYQRERVCQAYEVDAGWRERQAQARLAAAKSAGLCPRT